MSSSQLSTNPDFLRLKKELQALKDASDTQIKELTKQVKELEGVDRKRDAFGEFQFKDVIFNGTAHADTEISHDLRPATPDGIRIIPVTWEFLTLPVDPPYIYRNMASNARPWGEGYIILRCNLASAAVRMLLISESR